MSVTSANIISVALTPKPDLNKFSYNHWLAQSLLRASRIEPLSALPLLGSAPIRLYGHQRITLTNHRPNSRNGSKISRAAGWQLNTSFIKAASGASPLPRRCGSQDTKMRQLFLPH
jgi:hypothetical protein